MDGRRPRIKPSVNLQPKRKTDNVKKQPQKLSSPTNTSSVQNSSKTPVIDEKAATVSNSTAISAKQSPEHNLKTENVTLKDSNNSPFKRPPDIRNNSSTADNNAETTQTQLVTFTISFPEIQTPNAPTNNNTSSQTQLLKPRQRIRPTPYFGAARRSSIQGNSINDIEEDHPRRQRHLSEQGGQQAMVTDKLQSITSVQERNSNCADSSAIDTTTSANAQRSQIASRYRKISSSEDLPQKSTSTAVTKRTPMKYNNAKPVEKNSMKMLDFIYYNPSTNPMNSQTDKSSETDETTVSETTATEKEDLPVNNVQENAPAVPVPQLKLGPNGEVIIDEKSLVIETTAEKEGRKNLLRSEILYLDDNTGNNGFYKRQKRTKEWTSEETVKFYRCLHTVGTDFSLMLTLFPNRTRRDLKLKFKKEEKINLALVNKALMFPKAFNVDELRRELEKDDQNRGDNKVIKIIKKSANKQNRGRILQTKSKVARVLHDGDTAHNVVASIEIFPSNKKRFAKSKEVKQEMIEHLLQEKNKTVEDTIDEQTIFETLMNEDDDDDYDDDMSEDRSILEGLKDKKSTKDSEVSKPHNQQSNEDDIHEMLAKLNGSLVLVSSEDSNNPGKIINEIYIMFKDTKQLSDKPLDLPEDVINIVISEAFE